MNGARVTVRFDERQLRQLDMLVEARRAVKEERSAYWISRSARTTRSSVIIALVGAASAELPATGPTNDAGVIGRTSARAVVGREGVQR